jgi:hypothetical protein
LKGKQKRLREIRRELKEFEKIQKNKYKEEQKMKSQMQILIASLKLKSFGKVYKCLSTDKSTSTSSTSASASASASASSCTLSSDCFKNYFQFLICNAVVSLIQNNLHPSTAETCVFHLEIQYLFLVFL